MNALPVVLRQQAERDIEAAIAHYRIEAGAAVALRLVDELERALRNMGRYPHAGSGRYAHELTLPGLRFQPLRRFPYLVFYVVQHRQVNVWRVLHRSRDIPAWLDEPDGQGQR
ncbi:type II toxin-antitoxin system RelE/ParE family toxin [Flagellatimonas centrodinii]|uniref:type II toxin-antitoxin system RelE/ParE family toxin n=1 Tax=Flagellatimonas centrodinii TaxID=2806210 RepID=UPI001FF062EB|nr:type II toxin-antitoxin system RelE/ParE family toxin [Flagellatimonas centrodinii]ULQ47564.1 type II toxin-antitoxin system RelE/ParE family toxin [Flagellatimonas centrodinii]